MIGSDMERVMSSLPAGLTFTEVSRRLGIDYQSARYAIRKYGYKASDGRRFSQNNRRKLRIEHADWTQSNIAIARKFGVSRERVRILRRQLGKPFVESRGRKPCNGKPLRRSTDIQRRGKSGKVSSRVRG